MQKQLMQIVSFVYERKLLQQQGNGGKLL